MITKADIEKLAKLSRLKLTEAEKEKYAKDMDNILSYIAQIDSVAPASAKATAGSAKDLPKNVMRSDDTPHESGIFTDALLKLSPRSESGRVKVKKIL